MATEWSRPARGYVSIWIGDFRTEADLDGYLGPEFLADHGLVKADGDYSVQAQERPIGELLRGFFLSERWIDAALRLAEAQGVAKASCAVVRLHYRHEPPAVASSPLRFLGCVAMG